MDEPPAGNLMTGAAAAASGVPAGTVAFRNPMFGMDDIDNVTVVPQPNQQQGQQQQTTREGQVVIF